MNGRIPTLNVMPNLINAIISIRFAYFNNSRIENVNNLIILKISENGVQMS